MTFRSAYKVFHFLYLLKCFLCYYYWCDVSVMFQLWGLSGSRPFSWPSLRLSLLAWHRDCQRYKHKQTHTLSHSQFSYIIQTLYPNLSSPDFTSPGDEDRHRHSDVTVWEDRQWHQVLYQHTAGGRHLFEKLDYPQQTFNPGSWCAPKWVFLKKLHDENYFKIENTDKTLSVLNALSLY